MGSPPPPPPPPPPPQSPPPQSPQSPPSPCSALSVFPQELTLNIASFLEVHDLCCLGSCSRASRELCSSDFLWFGLCSRRWPSLLRLLRGTPPPIKGWKDFYVLRHRDLLCRVSTVFDYVKHRSQNNSLEVGEYLKAVENLVSLDLGFEDVKLFLFAARQSVLLNLIGLHYSMFCLGISGVIVDEVLRSVGISDRQICVFTLRLGRWSFGYRLPDERSYRKVTLGDLTTPGGAELCSILSRGAVHEVLRVQITPITVK